VDGRQAGEPDPGLGVALLGVGALVAGEVLLGSSAFFRRCAAPVAVVGLVVEHDDLGASATEVGKYASRHLVGRLEERAPAATAQHRLGE